MKVWITSYCLTKGIYEAEVEPPTPNHPNMVKVKGDGYSQWFHRPNWHEKRSDALAQAEKVRLKKVASLEKSLAKIKKFQFV